MRRNAITIHGETFASKAALQRRVRELLSSGPGPLPTGSYEFVIDLLRRHPSADEKLGVGVRAIRIVLAKPYNTRCLEIERIDGTRTDVSYLECLRSSTPREWFRACCRTAVVPQIQAARHLAFAASATVVCPISGELITAEDGHVDHAPPWTFHVIVDAFIAAFSIDVADVTYTDGDGVVESRFANADMSLSFGRFHAERAQLRVVSRRANLSLLRSG